MKKHVFGRQFKRDANERKALFKNLLTSLVLQERIKTTVEKAKAIRGTADKLVTKAKKGGDLAYKQLHPDINTDAVVKMLNDIAPRFTNRQGGYTRIIKAERRVADNAAMAYIEWTEKKVIKESVSTEKDKKSSNKKETKKTEATVKVEKTKKVSKKKDKKAEIKKEKKK